MHNIKKIVLRILLVAVVLTGYDRLVRFLYQPLDEAAPYIDRELEENEGKIDTLFCGTSTAYRGFSPELWEEDMGGCSFNIATASQSVEDSYVYIRQEAERNPVKRILLGVSPKCMMKEDVGLLAKVRIYDCLDGPLAKVRYLLQHSKPDEWLYLAYYPVRIDKYLAVSDVKKNVAYKTSQEYRDQVFPGDTYHGKGYFSAKKSYKGKSYRHLEQKPGKWDQSRINQREESYLRKILRYCKERQIELILVNIPVTGKQIQRDGDADKIHAYFGKMAEEYGAQFWDFLYYRNLIEEYTNDKFKDIHHLNGEGGKQFNHTLTEICRAYEAGEDLGKYFGDSCPYYEPGT